METWKHQRGKAIFRKNNGTGGINLPDYRLYYESTVIKTVLYWHKDRNMDQWNKIKAQRWIHAPMGTLSLTKETKIDNEEKKISLKENLCKWMKLEHFLTPYTKINLKWIKDLNVRPETIKLLEENRQNTLWHKSQQDPLWPTSQNIRNKSKNKRIGPS